MRGLFLTLGLVLSGLSFAQGSGAPPPVPAQNPSSPTTFVAEGEAVEIPDAGFTITPPVGWEVIRNGSGASLLFQTPKVEAIPGGPVVYQSNMRVLVMGEPRPIDDSTMEEFSKIILEKGSALPGVSNYAIRSANKETLQDGSEGFLYYTEFTQSSVPMMQMHILVSSATKHFLMTYTDLASVFEAENSPLLTTAYTSMQSAKLDSKPAERFASYYVVVGIILAFLVLLVFMRVLRGYKMKRLGERIESEDGSDSSSSRDDDDDDDDVSGIAELKSTADYRGSDDEDEGMPETREAVRPAPKAKKPQASAPLPAAAPKPKAPAPAAPAPAPMRPTPPAQEFGEENSEKTTSAGKAAKNRPVSEHEDDEWSAPQSDVSEIRPQTAVTTKKAKPQKVSNPAKLKDLNPEDASEVARISEILPNTGDTKKKKGFFGWGKGKGEDDEEESSTVQKATGRIGDEDSWDEESQLAKKNKAKDKKAKKDEPPLSEVAGWNLKGDSSKSRHGDDEEDD